jgi:ribosomal protein S18 acetylase RimI-like enzyme
MRGRESTGGRGFRVEAIDHGQLATARRIHAIWAGAALQEAALLQASLPVSSAETVAASTACFLGALLGDELMGALAFQPDDAAQQVAITTLVVSPAWQRHGIASALVAEALRRAEGRTITVVTAAANTPALALYRGFGFAERRRGVIENAAGGPALPIIELQRPADQ